MARRSAVEGAGRFNRAPSPTTSCLPSFILTATSLGRLLAQTPLPDEAREEHVAALREVIKEKRPDQKGAKDPWKWLKMQREPAAPAFTRKDEGKSLTVSVKDVDGTPIPTVKVNGVERAVLWCGLEYEPLANAKILSVEERIGGRLEVQGAEDMRVNPATGLVAQVLTHLGKEWARSVTAVRQAVWRPTEVSFEGEDGKDEDGLTVDMHTAFWKGVVSAGLGLFECPEDLENVHEKARRAYQLEPATCRSARDPPLTPPPVSIIGQVYLPEPGACLHDLKMVGLMLCKSLISGHPTGPGLGRFVFDFLLERPAKSKAFAATDKPVLEQAETAIRSLSHFDVQQGALYGGYLRNHETGELHTSQDIGVRFNDFVLGDLLKLNDDHELVNEPVTVDSMPYGIVASCKWILQQSRLAELEALRTGFTSYVDVTTQLRLLPSPDVMLVVQGRYTLSAEQLVGEIEWPDTAEAQAADEGTSVAEAAEFPPGSTTCELLRCTGASLKPRIVH